MSTRLKAPHTTPKDGPMLFQAWFTLMMEVAQSLEWVDSDGPEETRVVAIAATLIHAMTKSWGYVNNLASDRLANDAHEEIACHRQFLAGRVPELYPTLVARVKAAGFDPATNQILKEIPFLPR